MRSLVLFIMITMSLPVHCYSIVFVHLGKTVPLYISDAIKQARLFNSAASIYLIAQNDVLNAISLSSDTYTKVPIETLIMTPEHVAFVDRSKLDKDFRDGFWNYASERFLYIYDFMYQYDLYDLFHLEYDTMLYVDIQEIVDVFKNYYSIGAIFDNDNRCIPCFLYIANKDCMQKLAEAFAYYSYYGKNDMEIVALFKNMNDKKVIDFLPVVPQEYLQSYELKSLAGHTTGQADRYANNIELFNSIFDGAALGQYLGGCDPRNGNYSPGFINESSLFNSSNFIYEWENDLQGRRVPYIVIKNKKYRINNLHIHSKNLNQFAS